MVATMSRSILIISCLCLTEEPIKQVHYYPTLIMVLQSGVLHQNRSSIKIQLTQNKAAHLALHCSIRDSVEGMHARLSWMRESGMQPSSVYEKYLCLK